MKKQLILIVFLSISLGLQAQWNIENSTAIVNELKQGEKLQDNIEMAGRKVATIIDYSIDTTGKLELKRDVIFPQLHPYILENEPDWKIYRAYLRNLYEGTEAEPKLYIKDKQFAAGKVSTIRIDGMLHIIHASTASGLQLTRHLYPSMQERLFVEEWVLSNETDKSAEVPC